MGKDFKNSDDIEEIIAQVNRLKKEKVEILKSNKDCEVQNVSEMVSDEKSVMSGEPKSKAEIADMIKSSLNNENDDLGIVLPAPNIQTQEDNEQTKSLTLKEASEAVRQANKAEKSVPKSKSQTFELDRKKLNNAEKQYRSNKKSKKALTVVLFIIGIVVILVAGAYVTGLVITKDTFLPNTYINGVKVSGLNVEDASELIEANGNHINTLKFLKNDGSYITIPYEKFGYEFNTSKQVKKLLDGENNYLYFLNYFKDTKINIDLDGSYDEKKLKDEILSASFGTAKPKNAKIVRDSSGKFIVEPEKEGTTVDTEKVVKAAIKAVNTKTPEVDLVKEDCYIKPTVVAADLEGKLDELNKIFDVVVELDFDYTTEKLTYDDIKDAFNIKDDGTFTIDEEVVWNWVNGLRKKYDTLHKTRRFKSTLQGDIEINSQDDYFGQKDAIFGYMLDADETAKAVAEAFKKGESTKLKPVYYHNGGYYYDTMGQVKHDKSDEADVITDLSRIKSYIEVDLTNQTLWYYQDGKKVFECGVVSGLPTKERMTYPGIYQLWMKEQNKKMEGRTTEGQYQSQCSFWNYISVRSIGIHDATWNASFGGDRYKWAGSHGCVGVSYDSAQYIFDNIPIGTVVIMYY